MEEHSLLAQRQQDPDAEAQSALLLLEFQKLREQDVLTDCALVCSSSGSGQEEVRAHCSFVYAVCPALGRRLVQQPQYRLILPAQHKQHVVRKLVDYLYTRDTIRAKNERELGEILAAANELGMSELMQCSSSSTGSPSNSAVAVSEQHYVNRSTLVGHMGYVCALVLTEGGLLVSGSRDNSIRVWDYNQPATAAPSSYLVQELSEIHSDRVWALLRLRNAHNQERILSGSWDSTISVINPTTWKVEKRLSGHTDWVTCLCLVADAGSGVFASGSADGTVRVWAATGGGGDAANFQPERVLRGHRGHVYAMCASEDVLFSAGNDGFICAWDQHNWRKLARMDAHPKANIRALVWSARLNALLSGASDGKIRVWTKAAATPTVSYAMEHEVDNAHADWVEALVEMNNCRLASGSRDCTVRIWKALSPRKWELLQSIRQHSHWVYALVFTPGNVLISASCDMKIKIWEEEKEKDQDE